MVKVAILNPRLAAQMSQSPELIRGVEVVTVQTEVNQFRHDVATEQPHLLVVDCDSLGRDPVHEIEQLLALGDGRMVLVEYTFAKTELIRRLTTKRSMPIQGPLRLDAWQELLAPGHARAEFAPACAINQNAEAPTAYKFTAPAPRFSPVQLAALLEIDSAVDCECPNHLAGILLKLRAFERYSEDCSNKNEEDAKIHAMLHTETGRARVIMENALTRLCEFEGIQLDGDRVTPAMVLKS